MSTARSVFTEAIEDHLALKKQNVDIETTMPLARYDVGDPLDRYPGGPNRNVDAGTMVIADDVDSALGAAPAFDQSAIEATQMLVGPSPEQAMEAATALEMSFADRPFAPLTGMTPMLSLVEDIDEDDDIPAVTPPASSADVLRFPGGVGPRDEAPVEEAAPEGDAQGQLSVDTHAFAMPHQAAATHAPDSGVELDAATGEQPVLVIDTDEPLATSDWSDPAAPAKRGSKPRFFGLGRKKNKEQADGWFTDGPRDFNWD